MTTDQTIETEIVAKGLTAPRVTPSDIEANIDSEHYFTAADGIVGARVAPFDGGDAMAEAARFPVQRSLGLLAFCVLTLRNGFTVTGESACASPENFDAEIGRKIARANAVQKIWPLMGYALKQQLSTGAVKPKAKKPYTWDDVATYEHWTSNSTRDTEFRVRTKGDNGVYLVQVPYGTDEGAVRHVVMQECTRQRDSLAGEA